MLPDEKTIRRHVLLRLLGSPVVLAPAVLGATAAAIFWAVARQPAFGLFAAVAGLLGAVGAYLTRALLDDGRTARAVLADLEREQQAATQAALDALDRRLVNADQDPRPELALRDMRALRHAFEELSAEAPPEHLPAVLEVQSRVQQLFDFSLKSLEQTMKLHATARQLQTPDARRPLQEQRERLIAELQAGIRQLGATLASLQQLGSGDGAAKELARLRTDLDQSLQMAGRVEERLAALMQGDPTSFNEQPRRPATETQVKGD